MCYIIYVYKHFLAKTQNTCKNNVIIVGYLYIYKTKPGKLFIYIKTFEL